MSKLIYSIDEAAASLSLGKTKLYEELGKGKIKAIKIGRRTMIPTECLKQYIDTLPNYQHKEG